MARPRHITDERLIGAAGVAISRLGPGFTLADVAAEARVSVGTVAQRFGSKHGLLVAMTRGAIDGMRGQLRGPGDGPSGNGDGDDPVSTTIRAIVDAYAPLDDPATAANNLAQLAGDLADPELRLLMAEFYSVLEDELAALVTRAIEAGALPGAPPAAQAARILAALADGTAVHWSARPEGALGDRLRADLSAVLGGWRTEKREGT
ncbi:MAG: TetR/AcrR family transcriptional regulator [Actinoallomurus sp.]